MIYKHSLLQRSVCLFSHSSCANNAVRVMQRRVFLSNTCRYFSASAFCNAKKSNTRHFINHLYHGKKTTAVHQKHRKVYKEDSYSEYLYGRSVCQIALESSRRPIFRVLVNASWQLEEPDDKRVISVFDNAASRNIPIEYRHPNLLFSITEGRPHQGICLEVGQLPITPLSKHTFDDFLADLTTNSTLCVFLCDVKDPMNVGAILRTCHFLGVNKVIMTTQCSPITATASKASSGAAEVIPLYSAEEPLDFFQRLTGAGWDIIGTEATQEDDDDDNVGDFSVNRFDDDFVENDILENSSKRNYPDVLDISEIEIERPSLLVLGSEGSGIPPHLKAVCNKLVTIKENNSTSCTPCLNVSAAAAIILHHLVTKRR